MGDKVEAKRDVEEEAAHTREEAEPAVQAAEAAVQVRYLRDAHRPCEPS